MPIARADDTVVLAVALFVFLLLAGICLLSRAFHEVLLYLTRQERDRANNPDLGSQASLPPPTDTDGGLGSSPPPPPRPPPPPPTD